MPKDTISKSLEKFKLFWGIAFPGSQKYRRGLEIEKFLIQELTHIQKEEQANYEALLEVKRVRIRRTTLEWLLENASGGGDWRKVALLEIERLKSKP